MSALRDAAHRVARAGPLPMPAAERLLAIEKVVARHALHRAVPAATIAAWRDRLLGLGAIDPGGAATAPD